MGAGTDLVVIPTIMVLKLERKHAQIVIIFQPQYILPRLGSIHHYQVHVGLLQQKQFPDSKV